MKLIQLTRGQFTKVDDEDYQFLMQWKWYAHGNAKDLYARRTRNYRVGVNTYRCDIIHMHRVLMNAPDNMVVDHKDGDTLNNQRPNLRVCTVLQNVQNHKTHTHGTSGYSGVSYHATTRKWRARIGVDNKRISLGLYPTAEKAAVAYNTAAGEHFGEFARLNIIPNAGH